MKTRWPQEEKEARDCPSAVGGGVGWGGGPPVLLHTHVFDAIHGLCYLSHFKARATHLSAVFLTSDVLFEHWDVEEFDRLLVLIS